MTTRNLAFNLIFLILVLSCIEARLQELEKRIRTGEQAWEIQAKINQKVLDIIKK